MLGARVLGVFPVQRQQHTDPAPDKAEHETEEKKKGKRPNFITAVMSAAKV